MTRRALFIAILAVLLVLGIAVGSATASKPAPVPSTQTNAILSPDGTNAVSFCPGLPPALSAAASHVTFANVGTTAASLDLTVLPDQGKPVRRQLQLGPHTTIDKRRADLGPPGALNVESFGGRVVVEEGIEGPNATEFSTCSTQTSTQWEFAAGTTPRGAQQWLVIDDPYASDAKVDVVLRTNSGVRRPDQVQGLDIGRRSRAVIAIHDLAVRQDRVAVEVHATVGGVVAAQTLIFDSGTGTPGVATTVGAPAPADHWMFSEGRSQAGATSVVAIANVGDDTDVGVQTILENGQPVTPVQITLAADDVVWVKFGGCKPNEDNCVPVPDGTRFGIDVRAATGGQVVAQALGLVPENGSRSGVTTSIGVRDAMRSWVFARSVVNGERETSLAITNPTAAAAKVNVVFAQNNFLSFPGSLRAISVPSGRRVTVVLAGPGIKGRPDAALLVDATAPVVVERLMVAPDESTRSPGVPAG